MSINEFMNKNVQIIKLDLISKMPDTFDSHFFIKKFAKKFETEYIQFLSAYDKDQHQNVHKQIARNLQTNDTILGIKSVGTIESETCFGEISSNENWTKRK